MYQLCTCWFLGAFPVENTVGLVLEESKYSILDNWVLFSILKFLYCTFSFELVQAAVQFPESVRFAVQISTVVDEQTGFVLFPAKTHDKGVHADSIAEDVVKRQVQWTRQMRKHLKRFFYRVRVRTHKFLISWGLVRHIAHPLFLMK